MAEEHGEAFLNCVLKRNESDTVMRIGALLMVLFVAPMTVTGFVFYQVVEIYQETGLILVTAWDFVGIMILVSTTSVFYLLFLVSGTEKHYKRDRVWLRALCEYARTYGHDTSEMESLIEEFDSIWIRRVKLGTAAYFIIIAAINVGQAFFLFSSMIDANLSIDVFLWLMTVLNVELAVISLYLFVFTRRHDYVQCRFSEVFYESMKEDMPELTPMATRIKLRRVWPHIILMVATLGVYALIFSLWTLHTFNLHVSRQWTYEEKLLLLIMEHEKATGIRKFDAEPEKDVIKLVLNQINQIV